MALTDGREEVIFQLYPAPTPGVITPLFSDVSALPHPPPPGLRVGEAAVMTRQSPEVTDPEKSTAQTPRRRYLNGSTYGTAARAAGFEDCFNF